MHKPAFPHTRVHPDTSGRIHDGLSRRELFAAMAMQSLIRTRHPGYSYRDAADDAMTYADALITALDDSK